MFNAKGFAIKESWFRAGYDSLCAGDIDFTYSGDAYHVSFLAASPLQVQAV